MWLGWSGIRVAGSFFRCVLEFRCGWVGVVSVLQASWFDVCWSFGVVGLEWYPCCRLNLSFPHYKYLLQEKYVEYKHIFLPLLKLLSKILCHLFIVTFFTFGLWMQHFQEAGGLGETVRHTGHHNHRISPPLDFFYGGMLRTKCFQHQFQIL